MSTEERDEMPQRPRRTTHSDQEGERKPYNSDYSKPEGSYERRPYRSYGESNRPAYGDRPSRGSYEGGYGNRQGGYGNNNRQGGYNRPSFGNNARSNYSSSSSYEGAGRAYSATPTGEGEQGAVRKRRARVGETRVDYNNDARPTQSYSAPRRQQYDNGGEYGPNRQEGYGNRQGGYNNNRQGGYNNNRQGGYNNNNRQGGYNNNRPGASFNRQGGQRFTPRPKQIVYDVPEVDPNEEVRLNKFMANAGICSRREADELIQQGLVKVNGNVVTELGSKIKRDDVVEYNDKVVTLENKCYILLNKPKDCVTTSDDPDGRLTVMDIVKNACKERIYPVGRLDRNTTGVLLLTNDGDLASKLTHPKYVKKKIYQVWTDKDIAEDDMQQLADGIELEDGPIHADAISYVNDHDKNQAGIEIHSGRNRIVRRMFESLGYRVTKLDRVYFAGLTKKNLPRGRWRYLTQEEVNFLKQGSFE